MSFKNKINNLAGIKKLITNLVIKVNKIEPNVPITQSDYDILEAEGKVKTNVLYLIIPE